MATIDLINIFKKYERIESIKGFKHFNIKNLDILNLQSKSHPNIAERPFSIENLNLTIPDAKTMVILGPSGCGKTTILKTIAGLLPIDSGSVKFDGISMENSHPKEREIGMVFQNYALYPHFTSKTNVLSYFFFKKKTPELNEMAKEKYERTSELMGVDIEYLLDRKPTNLSGGEKQRVALARCITRDPYVFLLDEPFSNLDQMLREKYRINLKKLLREFDVTTVYVTHDQQEALILADLLAIMKDGRIEQVGKCEDIYNNPENIFVSEFLNIDTDTQAINLIEGRHISDKFIETLIGIRPEDITVSSEIKDDSIKSTVTDVRNLTFKNTTILTVEIDKTDVYIKIPLQMDLSIGDNVWVHFNKFHVFDKESERRTGVYTDNQTITSLNVDPIGE